MPSLRVYLDTAHWIDLAEGRRFDRVAFENAVMTDQITPVLSFVHAVELSIQEADSRVRVATYIEDLEQSGKLLWTRFLPGVAGSEIRAAYARWLGVAPQPVRVFTETFTESMEGQLYLDEWLKARATPFCRHVETLANVAARERHKEVREALVETTLREKQSGRPLLSRLDVVRQICSGVLQHGLRTQAGIFADVGPRQLDQFVRALDLGTCPALQLWILFKEGKALTKGGDSPSDVEDLNHLVGLAYCDVAFVDNRTWEALRKSKASPLPKRNSEFPQWLLSVAPSNT